MKVINPSTATPNADISSSANKAPVTFLSLPAELRNEIYELSGCLESKQRGELGFVAEGCPDGAYHDQDSGCELCWFDIKDGSSCITCLFHSWHHEPYSIWVNRNGSYSTTDHKSGVSKQSLRHNLTFHERKGEPAEAHGAHLSSGVEQPALTRVCKEVRDDTLLMFYGGTSFLFTIFDRKIDTTSLFKWLRTIGKQNAGFLARIKIVVRNKKTTEYVQKELIPALRKLGVRTEDDDGVEVVQVTKLTYPYCFCEHCIRMALDERY